MNSEKRQGSLLGAVLLVAGSCIGAGMLGLPISTGQAGFIPAMAMFLFAWLYMTSAALLLLEANLNLGAGISIDTLVKTTLGETARIVAWVTYLFLFYALMVAVIAGAGPIAADFFEDITHIRLEPWISPCFVVGFFASIVYFGTRSVDCWNRFFMIGLVLGYVLLIILGIDEVQPKLLQRSNWPAAVVVLPMMVVSFGFQNLIPTLTTYLGSNPKRITIAIVMGGFGALVLYVLWEWIVIGLLPLTGAGGILEAKQAGYSAIKPLKAILGASSLMLASEIFAFCAIVTTLLGIALSFVDFLSDGFNIPKSRRGRLALCGLVFLPPLTIALLYPYIFLAALGYAGGFGTVLLFGLFPPAMVWVCRYRRGQLDHQILPGGRLSIAIVALISLVIICLEVLNILGFNT